MNNFVYVAHPYGGKAENKEKVNDIMRGLVMGDADNVYLSPIDNFGMLYFDDEYSKGLHICLRMLDKCGQLVLCDGWETSKGCIGEWAYATAKKIPIYTLGEWLASVEVAR